MMGVGKKDSRAKTSVVNGGCGQMMLKILSMPGGIFLFCLIMPTHFRLSVYNVVANPGPETPCCDAR